jgi:glucose/mannose-6-phosphate isomerase
MIDDVLAMPDQLRDALWRVETARLEAHESAGLMVCGMGGSAIGGDLAASALGERLTKPLISIRGYELPSWATPEWTVLCSSYSGDTEETLACFEAAEVLGARRIVVSTRGQLVERAREAGVPVIGPPGIYQPRVAVAYMLVAAAEVAALAGIAPRIHTEIDVAAAFLEREALTLKAKAAEIAGRLGEGAAVIYGADLTAPVAHRWKTQFNENAKVPSFYGELPEADHNEIVGWAGARRTGGRHAAIHLADPDDPPTVRASIATTPRLIDDDATLHRVLTGQGQTRTGRAFWLLSLLDHASVHTARAAGVDPYEIDRIAELKQALAAAH